MRPGSKRILLTTGGNFTPPRLPGLQAWYDVSDLSSMLNASGAKPSSGDAIKLVGDKSGNSNTNAFVSGGAASNTATAPTASITGNQTLTADIQFADYTPGTNHTLFSKLNGNSGIEWLLLTTGVSRLRIGDGAAITNFDSTVLIPATDLVRGTLQVVYTDNTSLVTTWNGAAVGTTVVVNKTLANGVATATIGTSVAGIIYSLTVGSVYNFQPATAGKLAATFVAPTTGETWTINTSGDLGARICGARDLYQGTGANQPILTVGATNFLTFDGTNDYMKAALFPLVQPESVYFVGSQVTWTSNDFVFDGGATNSMGLIQDDLGVTPGLELFAGTRVRTLSTLALATTGVLSARFNGASSALRLNRNAPITGDCGAANANGFCLGANGAGAGNSGNITASEIIVRSFADPQSTQDQFIQYLGRKWAVAV